MFNSVWMIVPSVFRLWVCFRVVYRGFTSELSPSDLLLLQMCKVELGCNLISDCSTGRYQRLANTARTQTSRGKDAWLPTEVSFSLNF